MKTFSVQSIGTVQSSYMKHDGTPIQPTYGDQDAEILIDKEYVAGLRDLDGFERIWVISYLDRSREFCLEVVPYRDNTKRGLFSTRAPSRPNPIGVSCVLLNGIDFIQGVLHVHGIDLLDGTPVLDIKPYVPGFEAFPDARSGWLDNSRLRTDADNRFEPER